MGFETFKPFTGEEKEKTKSRMVSDANLVKRGAEIRDDGSLEATEDQIINAKLKMEIDQIDEAEMDQRMQEALEAFQTKYSWIKEGAKFRFNNQTPQPMEGLYRKEVYTHDFTDAIFTANGYFYKSKDGKRIEMGAETQITIVDEKGEERNPKIQFDFMIGEIDDLGIEEVK